MYLFLNYIHTTPILEAGKRNLWSAWQIFLQQVSTVKLIVKPFLCSEDVHPGQVYGCSELPLHSSSLEEHCK